MTTIYKRQKGGGGTGAGGAGTGAGGAGTGAGGGRGSLGGGGVKPGAGAGAGAGAGTGAGAGGKGDRPKTPPSGPPTSPRTVGPSSGIKFGGEPRKVSAYGSGGGPTAAIPAGAPFAGRLEGGGTRNQIFGTKMYGSGYSNGLTSRGVAGHPFPFYFWPVVWGGSAVGGGIAYLDATNEYGDINNSTRPGGPLSSAVFKSPSNNSIFRIMSDSATVASLVSDLSEGCSSKFSTNPAPTSTPLDVNAKEPRPEQAIQYYRASSIALTLDGYNNSATLGPEGTPETPLPSGVDMTLLTCLNQTIGKAAPLVDAPVPPCPVPTTTIIFNAGIIPQPFSSFDLVCLLFILLTLIKSFK